MMKKLLLLLLTPLLCISQNDFTDIEYNKKTQIKSRLIDGYTGTFTGSVIGFVLVYIFSLLRVRNNNWIN